MTLPASLRNQIKTEVTACIVEEGEEVEKCCVQVARNHGLSREQAEEIPFLLDFDEED